MAFLAELSDRNSLLQWTYSENSEDESSHLLKNAKYFAKKKRRYHRTFTFLNFYYLFSACLFLCFVFLYWQKRVSVGMIKLRWITLHNRIAKEISLARFLLPLYALSQNTAIYL